MISKTGRFQRSLSFLRTKISNTNKQLSHFVIIFVISHGVANFPEVEVTLFAQSKRLETEKRSRVILYHLLIFEKSCKAKKVELSARVWFPKPVTNLI